MTGGAIAQRRSAALAAAEQKPDRRLIPPRVNEANLDTPEPAGDRRKAIRQPVRPVNDDQPALRSQQIEAGGQPGIQSPCGQDMCSRAPRIRRRTRLSRLQKWRIGEHDIGALRQQIRTQPRSLVEQVGDRDPRPRKPLIATIMIGTGRRAPGRARQRRSRRRGRARRPSARPRRSRRRYPSPRRRACIPDGGGEQNGIGAGPVALGRLAQGDLAAEQQYRRCVSIMRAIRPRDRHRRSARRACAT